MFLAKGLAIASLVATVAAPSAFAGQSYNSYDYGGFLRGFNTNVVSNVNTNTNVVTQLNNQVVTTNVLNKLNTGNNVLVGSRGGDAALGTGNANALTEVSVGGGTNIALANPCGCTTDSSSIWSMPDLGYGRNTFSLRNTNTNITTQRSNSDVSTNVTNDLNTGKNVLVGGSNNTGYGMFSYGMFGHKNYGGYGGNNNSSISELGTGDANAATSVQVQAPSNLAL